MLQSSAVLIPIHINGSHWVALARRRISNKVIFLYCYDLNSPNMAETIRSQYSTSQMSASLHPPHATWIDCHSYTYEPHSNECGPWSILALTILSCHQHPSETILLPFMDGNIA